VPQPSVLRLRVLNFPPPFRYRPALVAFLRTNLISTRINIPIVRFRGSSSNAWNKKRGGYFAPSIDQKLSIQCVVANATL